MPETENPLLTMDLSWTEEDGDLVVTGCASFPEVDQENEIVLREAIAEALDNFMVLPVLHLDHTERPIGIVQTATFGGQGELLIRAKIKPTEDCQDVRLRIRSGELSQYSIFGRRIEGSESCRLNPEHREDNPCITRKLHLDSISVCPRGNAISPQTFLKIVKGIVVKSTNSSAHMIHPTADGVTSDKMENEPLDQPESAETGDQPALSSVLQQITDTVNGFGEKLDELLEWKASIESAQAPSAPAPEPMGEPEGEPPVEEPGPEGEPGAAPDEEVEKAGNDADYDMGDILQTIGGALQVVLQKLDAIAGAIAKGTVQKADLEDEEYPDDGYEDEEYSEEPEDGESEDEEEDEEIEKCSGGKVKKGRSELEILKARNAELEALIHTKRPGPIPVVVSPDLIVKAKEEGTSNNEGDNEPNPVTLAVSCYGGV